MASQDEDQPAFEDEEDTDMDDDTDIDDDDEELAALNQPPPNLNPNPTPDPTPAPPHNGGAITTPIPTPSPLPRIEERRSNPSSSLDDSRRLFQRLWTDDDEIKILKGFLDFTSSRGTTFASHQYDTGPFYQQIKNELQLDFNKNQLIEKLRRLKKKYRNTANRMANQGKVFTFKSPHEKATYEIARKIWSASIKRSRESDDDDLNPYWNNNNCCNMSDVSERKSSRSRRSRKRVALGSLQATPVALAALPPPVLVVQEPASEGELKVDVQTAAIATPLITPLEKPSNSSAPIFMSSAMEEMVKGCISPIFKELLNSAMSVPAPTIGLGMNIPGLGNLSMSIDDRWKKQQILELQVYLKRVELVRDQIKSVLEELKASKSAS